jgi:hypothetical protein
MEPPRIALQPIPPPVHVVACLPIRNCILRALHLQHNESSNAAFSPRSRRIGNCRYQMNPLDHQSTKVVSPLESELEATIIYSPHGVSWKMESRNRSVVRFFCAPLREGLSEDSSHCPMVDCNFGIQVLLLAYRHHERPVVSPCGRTQRSRSDSFQLSFDNMTAIDTCE